MRIKAGDLLPPLVVNLTDNGAALDITTATAVHVVGTQGILEVFDDAAPTRDNANGVVTHAWVAGETDLVGRMYVRVVVTWPGGKTQSFPPFGELAIDIED